MFNPLSGEDEEEQEVPDPYECRLYHPFKRVTEEFHFLDGSTKTLQYDKDVVEHRRVRVENDSVWKIQDDTEFTHQSFSFGEHKELTVKMEMIGKLNPANIPVVERVETEELVVYVETEKHGNRYNVGDNRVHVTDDFDPRPEDEEVEVRADL